MRKILPSIDFHNLTAVLSQPPGTVRISFFYCRIGQQIQLKICLLKGSAYALFQEPCRFFVFLLFHQYGNLQLTFVHGILFRQTVDQVLRLLIFPLLNIHGGKCISGIIGSPHIVTLRSLSVQLRRICGVLPDLLRRIRCYDGDSSQHSAHLIQQFSVGRIFFHDFSDPLPGRSRSFRPGKLRHLIYIPGDILFCKLFPETQKCIQIRSQKPCQRRQQRHIRVGRSALPFIHRRRSHAKPVRHLFLGKSILPPLLTDYIFHLHLPHPLRFLLL